MSTPLRRARPRRWLAAPLATLITALALSPVVARFEPAAPGGGAGAGHEGAAAETAPAHLLISEVMTGGASASDEFVELYNPTAQPIALDGLELIYVTASGATVTRKASWGTGSSAMPSGGHLLVANEAGTFASIGDVTYAGGLAATGGSVALRIQGASTAIDAVGWGAATAWLEGTPAPAPAASSSIERLPGGSLGSTQDTDDNLLDFTVNAVPDPQRSTSPPIGPPAPSPTVAPSESSVPSPSDSPSPPATPAPSSSPSATEPATPSPTVTPALTPTPTASASTTPSPSPITVAAARALPDGSEALIEAVALMDSTLVDGGGCATDGTGAIAVLPDGATFARGDLLLAYGTIGDRYAQRTLRVGAGGLSVAGSGSPFPAADTLTGAVDESVECQLVRIAGTIAGSPTLLSGALAYDVDDGSGAVRVLVATASGIDTSGWTRDTVVTVVGVVGQRDSSGTGSGGYRVQPRDPADVIAVVPPATPSPSPSPSPTPTATPATPSPSAQPSDAAGLMTIVAARAAASGAPVRVRGVVTMPDGIVDDPSAVIQDATGGILLRLGDEAGSVSLGALVELSGVRSTKSGMLTIRVDAPPTVLGTQAEPGALHMATGSIGESVESRLVLVRGAVVATPTRSVAGNVAFTVDDGSGPLRVTVFDAAGVPGGVIVRDAWVEIRGVVGQQTTGAQPDRGYRLWPRGLTDLRVVAGPAAPTADGSSEEAAAASGTAGPTPRSSIVRPAMADGRSSLLGPESPGTAAPGSGGSGSNDGPGTPHGASAAGGIDLAAAAGPSRPALALLVMALALCLLLGTAAWRLGALLRLREVAAGLVAGVAPSATTRGGQDVPLDEGR